MSTLARLSQCGRPFALAPRPRRRTLCIQDLQRCCAALLAWGRARPLWTTSTRDRRCRRVAPSALAPLCLSPTTSTWVPPCCRGRWRAAVRRRPCPTPCTSARPCPFEASAARAPAFRPRASRARAPRRLRSSPWPSDRRCRLAARQGLDRRCLRRTPSTSAPRRRPAPLRALDPHPRRPASRAAARACPRLTP